MHNFDVHFFVFTAGFNFSAMFPGSVGFDTNGMSKASEFESMKFAKQPKPIDMHALKRIIRQILTEKLELDVSLFLLHNLTLP